MKIKLRRPHSCLAYFLWLIGILLSLVLLNDLYARVRIFAAQAAALELAGELGYTPADLLRSKIWNGLNLKRDCWLHDQRHGPSTL